MAEPTPVDRLRTRRSLLAAAAGGAAAIAVGAIQPRVTQAASVAVMTEVVNTTADPTIIENTAIGEDALRAVAATDGIGVVGISTTGNGVRGYSGDVTDPASNTRQAAVVGISGNADGIAGNIGLTGVYGFSDPSTVDGYVATGVWGDSGDFGVYGSGGIGVEGDGGWGVVGWTGAADGIGVVAASNLGTGRALRVEGRAEFTRSGRTTIASGQSVKKVTLAGCTSSTLVIAVLGSNRSGRYVRAVVPASGYFNVYLNTTVTSTTYIVWIAFTNPANHGG